MPQTGTTLGHAHLYDTDADRTEAFEDQYHDIPTGGKQTGPSRNIRTGEVVNDYNHELEGRV